MIDDSIENVNLFIEFNVFFYISKWSLGAVCDVYY